MPRTVPPAGLRLAPTVRSGAAPPARIRDLPELVALLDDVARELRAGASLAAAVDGGLRRRPGVLPRLSQLLGAGVPLADALGTAATHVADLHEHERLVVQTLAAAAASGGHLARPVERAAVVLRERAAWVEERRAQSAPARLGAAVMTVLPPAFGAWSVASSTSVRHAYATSPVPVACAAAGAVVNVLGWWWMRRIIAGASR